MDWLTEDSIYPSLRKILFDRFKVNFTTEYTRAYYHGTEMGLDAFAYSYGDPNEAYIVKIEGTFGAEEFQQFLRTLRAFPKFFPEYADKPVYGMVAAVTIPDTVRQRVLKAGIYVARIHDNVCTLRVPRGFKAKRITAVIGVKRLTGFFDWALAVIHVASLRARSSRSATLSSTAHWRR